MQVESYDRFILIKNNKGQEIMRLTPDDAVDLINELKAVLESLSCSCNKRQQTNF